MDKFNREDWQNCRDACFNSYRRPNGYLNSDLLYKLLFSCFFLIYGFMSLSYVQDGSTLYILKHFELKNLSNWEGGGEYGYNLLKTLSFRKKSITAA